MMNEVEILIHVLSADDEILLKLSEFATIEVLKLEIYNKTNIVPSKQVINGWINAPNSEETIVQDCVDINDIIYLVVSDASNNIREETVSDNMEVNDDLNISNEFNNLDLPTSEDVDEIRVSSNFIMKYLNNFRYAPIQFNNCKLKNLISQAQQTSIEQRKPLILYLHNGNEEFSKLFCELLQKPDIVEVMNKFTFLGWDVEEESYHGALINALKEFPELVIISELINMKNSAAFVIVPVNNNITLLSYLRGKMSKKEILNALEVSSRFMENEKKQEIDLYRLEQEKTQENDIGSVEYQMLMADRLGDRDYDSFEFDQHEHLKSKIGFALYGPPEIQTEKKGKKGNKTTYPSNIGYNEKQNQTIDQLYQTILERSNEIAKWKDRVIISFIYNCTEPLPEDKIKRSKKYSDYNPKTDLNPVPIFVLRKCKGSENPCRVFIDHAGRTYKSWTKYITNNKLAECEMILPNNGRYIVTENGEIQLERHLSPACGIDVKILRGADIASVVGGLVSGGIFVAAAIPAITVAPVAIIAGGIIGLGVGAYGLGRSIYTVVDRTLHKESMSFANSEARGAYLNIVAGSLGFVGAGATMAVSQLATNGINISLGARSVVNTLSFVNITAGGVSLANSTYDVLYQWINERQTPSLLTLVQLSSSVLFFGNAVYNFKMAGTIVDEAQTKTMQDFSESLRSNRHRKTFTKLVKATVSNNNGDVVKGRADVISAIKNIQNRDEVFAVLTRSNKLFNTKGITVTAQNGQIHLDGVAVNVDNFCGYTKNDMNSVLQNLKSNRSTSVASEIPFIKKTISNIRVPNFDELINVTCILLKGYETGFKVYILNAVNILLSKLQNGVIDQLQSVFKMDFNYKLIKMTIDFFLDEAKELQRRYSQWKNYGVSEDYSPIFEYVTFDDKTKTVINAIDCVIKLDFVHNEMTQSSLKRFIQYFYDWFAKAVYDQEIVVERMERRSAHSTDRNIRKVDCAECGGYYYESI